MDRGRGRSDYRTAKGRSTCTGNPLVGRERPWRQRDGPNYWIVDVSRMGRRCKEYSSLLRARLTLSAVPPGEMASPFPNEGRQELRPGTGGRVQAVRSALCCPRHGWGIE